jgi:hypothetical protein
MFVSNEPVRIVADGCEHLPESEADAIYIKPKMDFGTKQRVMSEAVHLSQANGVEMGGGMRMDIQIGAYQTALLVHNVVRWSGPSFQDVACEKANILRLDPDEPLVEKVLREIGSRNAEKKRRPESDPNPKAIPTPEA